MWVWFWAKVGLDLDKQQNLGRCCIKSMCAKVIRDQTFYWVECWFSARIVWQLWEKMGLVLGKC